MLRLYGSLALGIVYMEQYLVTPRMRPVYALFAYKRNVRDLHAADVYIRSFYRSMQVTG